MSQKPPPKQFIKTPINGTKLTILISSAKGGVGKSTVAVNIAFALQNLGFKSVEAKSTIDKILAQDEFNDASELVKEALRSLAKG